VLSEHVRRLADGFQKRTERRGAVNGGGRAIRIAGNTWAQVSCRHHAPTSGQRDCGWASGALWVKWRRACAFPHPNPQPRRSLEWGYYHGAVIVKDQRTVLWQSQIFVAFKEQPKLGHPSSAIVSAVPGININVFLYLILSLSNTYIPYLHVQPITASYAYLHVQPITASYAYLHVQHITASYAYLHVQPITTSYAYLHVQPITASYVHPHNNTVSVFFAV
jgi:hypothetical protein